MNPETPIENVPRITKPYQRKLKKLGIKTVKDLIFHFPHRYEDFSQIIPIEKTAINEKVCIQGKIVKIENRTTPRKRMIITEAIVQDQTGGIKVVWFNQPFLLKNLKPGDWVCLTGKVSLGEDGAYLSSPNYERLTKTNLVHTARIVPVYPETEGISSRWLRYIIEPILRKTKDELTEPIPRLVLNRENILPIKQAIYQIHFPDSLEMAEKAKQRFCFEELLFLQLMVVKRRMRMKKEQGIPVPTELEIVNKFTASLPFELTNAQKKATWQILQDMAKPVPMARLLQGDVGSGKTVVATIAGLNTVKAGFQVALMAPTEILAKQHFQEISKMLKNFDVRIALLTSKEAKVFKKRTAKLSKPKLIQRLEQGEIDFLIGTHALIQKGINFQNLALVILDEQHRFGTEQRAKLTQQKTMPHLLSMTATPIPRSLALTVYGDLDLSLIDELPKGRKKILTRVVPPEQRKKAYQFIRKQIEKGRQAFVICPRIEPSEKQRKAIGKEKLWDWSEAKAVKQEYERLSKEIFPDLKISMLHGKMKNQEKEKVMEDFKKGKTNILVSTSVVEVGVDVPNASVMMIEGAERFGLAQLHQFRGRVGRSRYRSYCFVLTDSPTKTSLRRLEILIKSDNGFKLAEKDLQMRGPGDFLGKRQSGIPDLAMASLRNVSLVEKTRSIAKEILSSDPELKKHPLLRRALSQFKQTVHLE